MEAAVEKHWSVTVSDLQARYRTASCALCAIKKIFFFFLLFFLFFFFLFFFFFFSPAYYGLFDGATCGVSVWNGGLSESTASVHYLHYVLD